MQTYELHVAVQENHDSEMGEFTPHAERTFADAEEARRIYEAQDVGLLLCSYDRAVGDYTGQFAVAFKVVLDGEVLHEGAKNQMQYKSECVYE